MPIHFIRNLLKACPKGLQEEFHGRLRPTLEALELHTARHLKDELGRDLSEPAPKAVEPLEEGFDDAVAVMVLLARYRKGLRTTNCVERLKEEMRRRERVLRISQRRVGPASDPGCAHGDRRGVDDRAPLLRHGRVLGVLNGHGGSRAQSQVERGGVNHVNLPKEFFTPKFGLDPLLPIPIFNSLILSNLNTLYSSPRVSKA